MINAIIIDDESIHHDILKRNLVQNCPDVNVVAEMFSGKEALEQLPVLDFDILFMDIELGDMNSFELLQRLPFSDLHVIFITSFDNYALQAFKVHAIDYLLKPVHPVELVKAIDRAMSQMLSRERRNNLITDYSLNKNNKLLVSGQNEFRLIDIESITYCKSDGNYTDIFIHDHSGKEEKCTDTHNLKFYEEKLRPFGFIRAHQSFLVNREYVSRIRKNPCEIIMNNGMLIPVARERKQWVMDFFATI